MGVFSSIMEQVGQGAIDAVEDSPKVFDVNPD